jgi:hypothetical protein
MRIPARRMVPMAILGVLTLLAAAAVGLAVSQAPNRTTPSLAAPNGSGESDIASTSALVTNAIADTAAAKTAQYVYTSVTLGSSADSDENIKGFGQIDFTTRSAEDYLNQKETEQQSNHGTKSRVDLLTQQIEDLHTPAGTFQRFLQPSLKYNEPWLKLPNLGETGALDPLSALQTTYLAAPVEALTHVRGTPNHVAAVPTAQASLTVPTVDYTWGPVVTTCAAFEHEGSQRTTTTLSLWLDHQGHIRQIRSTLSHVQHGHSPPAGSYTITATLTFSNFGSSETITAPTQYSSAHSQQAVAVSSGKPPSCHTSTR